MKNTATKLKNNKTEKNKVIFIAPAIVIIWLLVIYAVKGIFPFGDGTIVQYDLQYGVVPATYYHLWDAFHGGNLFYDFTTACGFGRGMLTQLFYPTNIFILLLKREWIYAGVSVLLILKLAVVAFTSSFAFSKIFTKLPSYYTLLITVMYTFCGYNLMYYTNIDWLDTVALYPLIILFALNMFKGKSKLPYFFALAYTLTFNTYMAWFVVISLVVFGGTYIFTLESKENRKRDIYQLGTGTGAALIASAYSVYSYFCGITGGARYGKGNYYFDSVTGTTVESNGLKAILEAPVQIDLISVLMFLGFACAIAFYILLLVRSVKNKSIRKATLFFTVTLVFLLVEGVINASLLLWHGGSFQHFPYRNGYMVAFFCCLIIGYYISNFADAKWLSFKRDILNLLQFAICILLAVGIVKYANVFYFSLKQNFALLNAAVTMQAGSFLYPYSRFIIILIVT
ncbi:MAG: YfhO family protein, partial [Clostridia bacterium]|nr:YfhO family protein [Clostridia bacterium]